MADNPTIRGVGGGAALAVMGAQNANAEKLKLLEKQGINDEKTKEKALEGFEALLLHELMKSMWSTVETTGLLGENSNEGQIYRDMLNQAVADNTAKGRGIGVKKMLIAEMNRHKGASKVE